MIQLGILPKVPQARGTWKPKTFVIRRMRGLERRRVERGTRGCDAGCSLSESPVFAIFVCIPYAVKFGIWGADVRARPRRGVREEGKGNADEG